MKIVLVDQSAADRKYYRILLTQAALAQAKPSPVKAGRSSSNPQDMGSVRRSRATNSSRSTDESLVPVLSLTSPIEFFEACRGAQALTLCREISPDCILLDYKLPDMDGLEFLAQLHISSATNPPSGRQSEYPTPLCAVVMLTGVASEQVAVRALRAGAQDYLVKDRVSAESLSLAIDKATQKVSLIRQLQEERDRLARALQEQAQMLDEKEMLIQEVHHRVKNNLQVIGSLLHLQAESLNHRADAAAVQALLDSQHRVEAMAVVHDQLYESGRHTVDAGGPRELDLGRHASLLLANLFLAYGIEGDRVARNVLIGSGPDDGPLMLSADQAIPVGLILNELVSNALKHAFPDGKRGRIEIEARCCLGKVKITVRDDGAGMVQDFDPATSKSLGLKIVHVLTRQLKGTLQVENQAEGTAFHISFPERAASFRSPRATLGRSLKIAEPVVSRLTMPPDLTKHALAGR